jgi:serine/threonine-protein kinase
VYSLGVVLFELLTGEVPFPGENFVAVAMKHMNEPPPDLLEKRPDVPLRLAAAVDRALEKDPARRFPTMDQFAWELRQCLAELDAPDAERTFIAQSPVLKESRPRRVRAKRSRTPAYLLVALLAIAAIVGGVLGLSGSKGKKSHGSTGGGTVAHVKLSGVGDYDPQGNGGEYASTASQATDGNPSTYWRTEHYASASFGGLKQGLGLVVDAGRPVQLGKLTVTTDTPGFTAKILAGSSSHGGFKTDSASRTVNGTTTFTLNGASTRYYVVWITQLPSDGYAQIQEVKAQ